MFKELFTESINIKNLPKTIKGGEYGSADFYKSTSTTGSYQYAQQKYLDYEDDEENYDDEYRIELNVTIKDAELLLSTKVLNFDKIDQQKFAKQYSNLSFKNVKSLVAKIKAIIKEFDKL